MDAGWMFSGFCEGGAAGLCRGGSLWDCSLQFLLNYSSTGEQGQARSVCSTGNLTPIHTCKCNERKGKLEQILWGNPRLPHLIKACRSARTGCYCQRREYHIFNLFVCTLSQCPRNIWVVFFGLFHMTHHLHLVRIFLSKQRHLQTLLRVEKCLVASTTST